MSPVKPKTMVEEAEVTATIEAPAREFPTDIEHFYGIKRQFPIDVDCPILDHKYIDTNNNVDLVSRIVSVGLFPVLLLGDTGTGKTECLKHMAAEMGHGLIRINHNVRSEPEDIIGSWVVDESGKPVLSRGPLVEALEDGKIYYADELNYAKPGILMAYQPVLENRGTITLTLGKTKTVIKRHPNFRFVAAMNPMSYAGANEMSAATLNRFIVVQFDYATPTQEVQILQSVYPSLPTDVAKKLTKLAAANRSQRQDDYIAQYIISTRDLIKVCHLTLDLGVGWADALNLVILNTAKEINPAQIDALETLIKMHCASLK